MAHENLAHADSLDRGVLHRDISINNIMLYLVNLLISSDDAEGSTVPAAEPTVRAPAEGSTVPAAEPTVRAPASQEAKEVVPESRLKKGLLVDFDYAMLTDGETFTFKGTVSAHTPLPRCTSTNLVSYSQGTLPFVSYRILRILQKNFNADLTGRQKQIIDHRPADDLESLFYVLLWICMLYDGPNKCPRTDIPFERTPLYKWAEQDFARGDFEMCSLSKFQLMTSSDTATVLSDHITPYFKCLEPFLLEWRDLIGSTFDKHDRVPAVQHDVVLEILNRALTHIRSSNTGAHPSDADSSHPSIRTNNADVNSTDVDSHPPQTTQKRTKRSIPPSDRELRPRTVGVSLAETLTKRVPLIKKKKRAVTVQAES